MITLPGTLSGYEPFGPITFMQLMETFMPDFEPVNQQENLMIGGLFGNCWLMGVDGKMLRERPKAIKNCFGRDVETVLYHQLDTETHETNFLHKIVKAGARWTEIAKCKYDRLTFCFDGLPIEFRRASKLTPEAVQANRELSDRAIRQVAGEDEEIATLSAICTTGYALTRQASRLKAPEHVNKVRSAPMQKWSDGSISRRKTDPENLLTDWRFNDWDSCAKRAKEEIIHDGISNVFGSVKAERYRYCEDSKTAWREECRWDRYDAKMRIYRYKLEVNAETILMIPELSALWSICESALEKK